MARDHDDLDRLLFTQDSVLTRAQACRWLSVSTVRHRVRSGRWRRVHRGIYVTQSGPLTEEQRLWVAVLACGDGAVLAGATAAARTGLRGHLESAVHVLTRAELHPERPPSWVASHRTTVLNGLDANMLNMPPQTRPARSIVDAAQWAGSDDRARAIVFAGFQQRLVYGREVHEVLERLPRARRHALISEAATDAIGGAQSLPEAEVTRMLRRHGLPLPSRQVRRRDASGRLRYLDLYYDEWKLHIEIDGAQHMEVSHWWSDMERQNDVWIAGDRVLRYPAWAIRHKESKVAAQICRALVVAGWIDPRGRRS